MPVLEVPTGLNVSLAGLVRAGAASTVPTPLAPLVGDASAAAVVSVLAPFGEDVAVNGLAPGAAVFTLVTPPTPTTGDAAIYSPNFVAGPTGKDPYAPWSFASVDGVPCFANGVDQPWRWDETSGAFDLGSYAPTTFVPAFSGVGTAIPNGATARYYLVYANSSLGKETAPETDGQGVAGVEITNTTGSPQNVTIPWDPTEAAAEMDVARIYRQLDGTNDIKLVAEVPIADGTYTDTTPDGSLELAEAYVWTYATEPPPAFETIFSHGNRLWGFDGKSSIARYAQVALPGARYVADDFPEGWQLPVEPNDPYGVLTAAWSHNADLYFFREEASYLVDDSDFSNLGVFRMFAGRGCIAPRTMVETRNGVILILDKKGIYGWIPGGQPQTLGLAPGSNASRLAPVWKRMNLGARRSFFAVHDDANSLYILWIALDHSPVPNFPVVYDYERDRFLLDPYLWRTAGGHHEDSSGRRYRVGLDDLGDVWQEGVGNSDGVYAGTINATLATATTRIWTAVTGTDFDDSDADGAYGSLVARISEDGEILDLNRVGRVDPLAVRPLYWSPVLADFGQHVSVGFIPAVAQGGKSKFGSDSLVHVTGIVLEHDVSTDSPTALGFLTAGDERPFRRPTIRADVDLATAIGRNTVNVSDRGSTVRWLLTQGYAGQDFAVRAMTWHMGFLGSPR